MMYAISYAATGSMIIEADSESTACVKFNACLEEAVGKLRRDDVKITGVFEQEVGITFNMVLLGLKNGVIRILDFPSACCAMFKTYAWHFKFGDSQTAAKYETTSSDEEIAKEIFDVFEYLRKNPDEDDGGYWCIEKILRETMGTNMEKIVGILMERDGMTRYAAVEKVWETHIELLEAVNEGDFPVTKSIIRDYLGLEPEYIRDLI